MQMMTHRERILTAFSRRKSDKIPRWIASGEYLSQLVKKETGSDDPAVYFDLDIQEMVCYLPTRNQNDFSKYPSAQHYGVNEWGTGDHKVSPPPMKYFQSKKEVEAYPFPDVGAAYRYEHLPQKIREIKGKGLPAVQGYECGAFEQLWALRGMEDLLVDFYDSPEFILPLLERVSGLKAQIAENYAKAGVDIVWTGDDLGSERAMLMEPEMWRRYLKPCVKKIIAGAKKVNPDVLVAFHSDGYMEPIIPDLISVGVDILQAVQPECMEIDQLKKKFGSELSFWGTIGTQTTMAFGTPGEVKEAVRNRLRVFREGGICIGPSHTLEYPTPFENISAFVEAVELFGNE